MDLSALVSHALVRVHRLQDAAQIAGAAPELDRHIIQLHNILTTIQGSALKAQGMTSYYDLIEHTLARAAPPEGKDE